jgi:hypothetical protein
MNMQKYYSQLIGCKIIGFRFESDEYSIEPFPIFTLQLGNQKVDLALSMDEEGNGGGFGFIEEVK